MADDTPDRWTIEKKIPLAFILALIAQTVLVVAFIVRLEGRVATLEAKDAADTVQFAARSKLADERYDSIIRDREKFSTGLARVEEQMKGVNDSLRRIEDKLPSFPFTTPKR